MNIKTVKLSDSRTLTYCEYGDPNGIPVFYAHGGPGSRLEGSLFHEKAVHYGMRLIATDRPGMGGSTFKPDRGLLDYPDDLAELADLLKIEKFGVLGTSGGGAHTVICGYALPQRLIFNIALCGYTNFAELPGAEKMLPAKIDQIAISLSKKHPRLWYQIFSQSALQRID